MTMIARFSTKKALAAAVADAPEYVQIEDPAFAADWLKYGHSVFTLDVMKPGDKICVTNPPKRSWFAEIACLGNGRYKVK